MLNVGKIEEGFVLDHIKAGKSLDIYDHLQLDKLDCTVAIIKNARSEKMGKKDILKVECDIDMLDLDVLGYIDHNITVNVIKNGEIVEKKDLVLPRQIKNVIKCHNPRCITSIEQELPHIFSCRILKKKSTAVNTAKKNTPAGQNSPAANIRCARNKSHCDKNHSGLTMDLVGFEPMTSALRTQRSPN